MTSEQERTENFEEVEFEDGGEYGSRSPYSQSDYTRGGDEDEEEGAEEELFSRLGESSDDPEQKRLYVEYLGLLKSIECQNQVVDDLKIQIMEMCAKPCKTRCEMKEIQRMRTMMEQEDLKLRCLINQAMKLQNFGSRRRYHEIPLATTLDEDNLHMYNACVPPCGTSFGPKDGDQDQERESSSEPCPRPCPKPCPPKPCKEEKPDKSMRSLCNCLLRMKICCPEDKKMLKEICAQLCPKKPKRKPCSYEPPCPKRTVTMRRSKSTEQPCPPPPCEESDINKVKQKILCLQDTVNKLKQEICRRETERQMGPDCMSKAQGDQDECGICLEPSDPMLPCMATRKTKTDQIERLKGSYLHLLTKYNEKDCKLQELEKRIKGMCGSCGGPGGKMENADQSELQLLRIRVSEMQEEQTEFKCLMKEQSQQLDDYRNKYLVAQQRVEEQCVQLEKLNMNNRRIEKQVNSEIKDIRAKFQEKLNELLHFPKLLENEQLKLAQTCKEKEELEGKLALVCKELKAMQAQLEQPKDDCRPQLLKCQMELQTVKNTLEEVTRQRDLYCEQLKTTQDDLDTLRSESAKIIARTKERSELLKQKQNEHIDRLEKDLAQCRASACLSVNDREAVIREMQGQLNTLSYSFDAAQKQIKTLRNHIAYVSNENCFPVKC